MRNIKFSIVLLIFAGIHYWFIFMSKHGFIIFSDREKQVCMNHFKEVKTALINISDNSKQCSDGRFSDMSQKTQ